MSLFKRFKQALGGIGKGEQWQEIWTARLSALTGILGEEDDKVYHSPNPFYLGGDADVLVFPHFVEGLAYVTADLTGESDQLPSDMGNYELMICTRSPADWAASLISRLSRYTLEATLNPGETMDCAMFGASQITALLFAQLDTPSFSVLGQEAGLLLCLGITQSELDFCHEQGADALLAKLREAGIFPFTDLDRQPIQ